MHKVREEVAIQVGAVKIYVTAVEQQWRRSGKKKDRMKLRKLLSFTPPLDANLLFCRFFLNLTLCMTKLRVLILSFPDFMDISIMLKISKIQSKCYSST
jgi:hypothetical protein